MNLPTIQSTRTDTLLEFLALNDFEVETLENAIYKVTRSNELPVYLSIGSEALYFEVDLGSLQQISRRHSTWICWATIRIFYRRFRSTPWQRATSYSWRVGAAT